MYDKDGNFYKPDRGSAPEPDHILLSISGDARVSMAVSWRTSTDVAEGYVEYRKRGGEPLRADARVKTLESDIDISNFWSVTLTGLEPGTEYSYTVGDERHRSGVFTFTTEPENLTSFKFLVIADPQRNSPWESPDYSIPHNLLARALEEHPDTRFIISAGDNCDNGQNELQWNGLFSGLRGIAESVPFMMATGNHDNRGHVVYLPEPVGKFYLDHADYFDAQFEGAYPQNGPEGFTTENYSFDYGDAHFLILGINAPEKVGDWAYDDLHAGGKKWKLGVYHFPIYPIMPEGQNDDAYPWLRKPIERGRLDVLFAGHEHSFARTYPMRDDELCERPSEGTIHYIVGNAGRSTYCSNARKIWHPAFYPQEEDIAMITVAELDGDTLTLTAVLEDGRVIDRLVIDKAEDTVLPVAPPPVYKRTKLCYKGAMLDFAGRGVYPCERGGEWYVPFAVLIAAVGGAVAKTPGKASVTAYGTTAVFTEGSACAETSSGEFELSGEVFRGDKGQLYMPADSCARLFGMKWQYSARNNIINFDHPSEDSILSPQP